MRHLHPFRENLGPIPFDIMGPAYKDQHLSNFRAPIKHSVNGKEVRSSGTVVAPPRASAGSKIMKFLVSVLNNIPQADQLYPLLTRPCRSSCVGACTPQRRPSSRRSPPTAMTWWQRFHGEFWRMLFSLAKRNNLLPEQVGKSNSGNKWFFN